MDPPDVERKLTTILCADAAGYSRLMGAREEATLRTLRDCRKIIDSHIAESRGRIFGSAGDSVMAEFPSAVEAVRCAVAIQAALAARESDAAEERRMPFRIGINLGDVMVEGADLLGEGVNVAARLQALAERGGICVSTDAYRQVRGKLDVGFADMGEREVKNIAEPVRVYRVLGAAEREDAALDRNAGPAQTPAASPHILIVDDDREIRDLLARFLAKHGYRVEVAADGRAMRKALAEWRIDLVVLDLMMPGEDGLVLCRRLRAESSVPVIMLTAMGEDIDRIVGLEIGADDYVPKPFNPRELLARKGRAQMWIELGDGTWLNIVPARAWHSESSLIYFGLMVVIVGGGLAGLAVFVARWVTAPLGRFATASARLGHDVDAPPLGESGPAEIRRAAQAFNQMQRRIRRFMDERMHMLAAASHDLRTPITRLKLRAELIEDAEQRAKTLKDLDEMEAVIASTIAYAREETTSEQTTAVDLARLVGEIRTDLAEAGHAVTVEGPATLVYEGRATALKRALANLIGNAVIYGGAAAVRLGGTGGGATITIEDSGPGIPEAEREKVFEPFYRLERSRSRETGGAGLGLSVARTVIRGHDGEVTLTNRAQGGLRQEVVLPRPE